MKLKMLRSTNDTQYGFLHFGDIIEISEDDTEKGERWIKRKIAIKSVDEDVKVDKPKTAKSTVNKPKKSKPIVEETEDEEALDTGVVTAAEVTFEQLKEQAKELNIPYYKTMKENTLKTKVAEAKAGVAKLNRRAVK